MAVTLCSIVVGLFDFFGLRAIGILRGDVIIIDFATLSRFDPYQTSKIAKHRVEALILQAQYGPIGKDLARTKSFP